MEYTCRILQLLGIALLCCIGLAPQGMGKVHAQGVEGLNSQGRQSDSLSTPSQTGRCDLRFSSDSIPMLEFSSKFDSLQLSSQGLHQETTPLNEQRMPVVGIDIPYVHTQWLEWTYYDRNALRRPKGFFNRAWVFTKNTLDGVMLKVGLNAGVSTPLAIPAGVRLVALAPAFAPHFSVDRDFVLTSWLLLNTGLHFEYKGMSTKASVHDFYTEVTQRDGDVVMVVKGTFTGYNNLKFLSAYVGIPVRMGFVLPNKRTVLRVGGYASYSFTRYFRGSVADGYLWTKPEEEGGNSDKLPIENESFDFSDMLVRWDAGVELSLRQRLSRHIFMDAGFTMGFIPILKKDFQGVPYKMRNMYLSLGVGYKFLS